MQSNKFRYSTLCGIVSEYHEDKSVQFEWRVKDLVNANLKRINVGKSGSDLCILGKIVLEFSNGEKGGYDGKKWEDEYILDDYLGKFAEIRC